MSEDAYEIVDLNSQFKDATDFFLEDIEEDGHRQKRAKVPFSSLSSLGVVGNTIASVVSKLAPTGGQLYEIANGAPGFALKQAKDGTYWGALKNADGISKMAKFKEVAPTVSASSCVAAVAVVVAVMAIEHQINKIIKNQEEILSFLENEKQAAIEGDVRMLKEIMEKYSCGFENERFMSSNHIIITDIRRKALAHMISYKKDFDSFVNKKDSIITFSNNLQDQLDDLIRKFKYYRLSVYTYCMSSFLDIVFSCELSEEYILKSKQLIEEEIKQYDYLYEKCLHRMDEKSRKTLESNVVKGYGKATRWIGEQMFGNATNAGQNFINHGDKASKYASDIQERYGNEFETMKESKVTVFVNKLEEMNLIYNKATRIACDNEYLYMYA